MTRTWGIDVDHRRGRGRSHSFCLPIHSFYSHPIDSFYSHSFGLTSQQGETVQSPLTLEQGDIDTLEQGDIDTLEQGDIDIYVVSNLLSANVELHWHC